MYGFIKIWRCGCVSGEVGKEFFLLGNSFYVFFGIVLVFVCIILGGFCGYLV